MYTLLYYCSMMDVKGIIQKWYKELSEDASVFEEHRELVSGTNSCEIIRPDWRRWWTMCIASCPPRPT